MVSAKNKLVSISLTELFEELPNAIIGIFFSLNTFLRNYHNNSFFRLNRKSIDNNYHIILS